MSEALWGHGLQMSIKHCRDWWHFNNDTGYVHRVYVESTGRLNQRLLRWLFMDTFMDSMYLKHDGLFKKDHEPCYQAQTAHNIVRLVPNRYLWGKEVYSDAIFYTYNYRRTGYSYQYGVAQHFFRGLPTPRRVAALPCVSVGLKRYYAPFTCFYRILKNLYLMKEYWLSFSLYYLCV